jgi:outer membrane receptor for ferrienterochelin and colicin
MRLRVPLATALIALLAVGVQAQTTPTGTITGSVKDASGGVLPGVTVTVASPSLQGTRSATTSANGDYIIPFLPAGEYTVRFEMSGFQKLERKGLRLQLAESTTLDAQLSLSTVTEELTVTAESPADFTQAAAVASSYKQDLIEKLPLARTLASAVLLAPGTNDNGPNTGIMISGALSYENLFLVNGVVVNETLRGQPRNLYIEDSIEETKTITGNISAEYGRLSGGVVNMLTKSGGNDFTGSFRTTFESDNWRSLTPYEETLATDPRNTAVVPTYEATLGGPILKDKLWFFGAGRFLNNKDSVVLRYTQIPVEQTSENRRFEGKLTYSVTPKHTFKGAYGQIILNNYNTYYGSGGIPMDTASLYDIKNPESLLSLNYTGILTPKFFIEAQYSRRQLTFEGSGSRYTDLVKGTLMFDRSRSNVRYNSPTFCAVCGAAEGELNKEHRDNQDILLKASYFLSTKSTGSHSIVAGFDGFEDKRQNNNYQSGSAFRVYSTATIVSGTNIYPVFQTGNTTRIYWTPLVANSQGSSMRTYSAFLNDSWRFNDKLSFNVGLRYDKNLDEDQTGVKFADDSAWSPRLSVTFDPKGDGNWTFNAGFARYVMSVTQRIGDIQSAGGRTATYRYDYGGPSVNTGNPANPLTTEQALNILWGWFNANGGTNRATRDAPAIPGVTEKIGEGLISPHGDEAVLGVSRKLGNKGLVRVDGVYRKYKDFYGSNVTMSTGRVADSTGRQYDLAIVTNTNDVQRDYKGINFQFSYRINPKLDLGANYTLSQARGNFSGETATDGPTAATVNEYPEYKQASWNYPVGNQATDQRHKLRVWANWELPIPGSAGKLNLGLLQRYDSYQPSSTDGTINIGGYVTNPGYLTPPASQTYYFNGRGDLTWDSPTRTDIALNYAYTIRSLKRTQLFFRGTIYNLFNQTAQVGGDETILTSDTTSTMAKFNPFTTQPVEGVNWAKGPLFGQATSSGAYQLPRTYGFSVGVRF